MKSTPHSKLNLLRKSIGSMILVSDVICERVFAFQKSLSSKEIMQKYIPQLHHVIVLVAD
jgi:hypothetical protein